MGLESGTYLNDLNTANPDGADPKSQGDDHLRLIKSVLKATFPGMAGAAWRVQGKSAGYTVAASDNMSILNCTSALTLSGTAAATLGNQHMVAVFANGGDVIFDPSGAETVNGASTITVLNGAGALIFCTGSAFIAIAIPGVGSANVWTALQTFRVAGGIRVEQAATQDAIVITGRAGGSSSYEITHSPTTLTADRTVTWPDASGIPALLESDQAWTGSQRGTPTTDNDLSFDLNAANNFTCTPTAGGALTFTNHTAGQSGFILLVNGSNYAITAAATTKVDSSLLATISVTGTYLLSYYDNGTNAYVVGSKALS